MNYNCKFTIRQLCLIPTIVFLLVAKNGISQTNPLTPKINIPTSPEAAMIQRFGEIPIGYYTGTANVSIPIYTLREGSIEIPINLEYHGSGIKVDDQATWVGLGWNLAPEGTIIQEVRGKSDEDDVPVSCSGTDYNLFLQRLSYVQDNTLMFLPEWGRAMSSSSQPCAGSYVKSDLPAPYTQSYQDPFCIIQPLLEGKGQPDIYSYSFNGQSGKFYIHPDTHEIIVIDKTDQVYFAKPNQQTITATTLDGTIFTFGAVETANGGLVNEYTGKTYKLTNIRLLTGKSVSFTYSDQSYVERSFNQYADINRFTISTPAVNSSYSYTYHNKKALSKITSSDVIVDFNLSTRDDINVFSTDNVQKLTSVDISSKLTNKKIRTFQFTYDYFPYNQVGAVPDATVDANLNAFGKRLKLNALKEIGYDDAGMSIQTKPPYQFEYDLSNTMPLKTSFAKDFWGYYNGEPNNMLLPNLDYFDYFYQYDYKAINQTLVYPYTGANRYTDNTKAGAYMLNKITYPTGGFTVFEYEPNTFNNQFIPDQSQDFNKDIYVDDNSIGGATSAVFPLGRSTNIHFENSINNGKGNYNNITPLTYSQMSGCYILFTKTKLVSGSPVTTTVKRWDLSTVLNVDFTANGGKQWSENLRVDYDSDPTVSYRIQVNFPDNLNNILFASIAGVRARLTFQDNSGLNISQSKQGGMRIKNIFSYTETGNLAGQKSIKYYNGKLLNKFRPLTVYQANDLNGSGVTNGNYYEYIAFYKKITASGSDFGMGGSNLIGYDSVEETEITQGSALSGKKLYQYSNQENITRQGCPTILKLRNGFLLKEEVFNQSNTKLMEKTYSYSYLQPFPAKFIGINVVRLSTGAKVPCGSYTAASPYTTSYYDNQGAEYNTSEYGYNVYTINAEWSKLSGIQTKQFSGTQEFVSTESYTYDSEGKRKSTSLNNSKDEVLLTKFYYPTDGIIQPYIDNAMVTVHNTSTPVKVENYKNSTLLSSQRTMYGSFPGVPALMPQHIYSQKGSNAEDTRVTIDSYDNLGNITQYTEQNNIPVSFVWNADKTLPIAKIENATYASLLALPGGLNADFRSQLPNARVTSYTYKPLIGVNTLTDVNNRTARYEYDPFGQLALVWDWEGKIVKKICYNYNGQPIDCSTPSVTVSNTNTSTIIYNVTLTNTATGVSTNFTAGVSSISQQLGKIAVGIYNVNIYPAGASTVAVALLYSGIMQTGVSFQFSNISLSSLFNFSLSQNTISSCPFSKISDPNWACSYNSFYSSSTTVTFSLVLTYAGTFSQYYPYQVGTVAGTCKPGAERNFTVLEGSRHWMVKVSTTGLITIQLVEGSVPSPGSVIQLTNASFNL